MTSPLSVVLDGLVSDARSTRDGVFNTLDAVDRRTKLASASLARQVQRFCAEQAAAAQDQRASSEPERDDRFDPEDEWDLRAGDALASGAAAATGTAVTGTAVTEVDAPAATDDEDDYPQTWLR